MRCIILNKNISYKSVASKNSLIFDEIESRIEYFKDIFNLYYNVKEKNNNIAIVSFPTNELDYAFIIGHNNQVYDYLINNYIPEKTIILITCYYGRIKKYRDKNKRILIPNNNDGQTKIYDGRKWNFNFDITDCELNLYKSKEQNCEQKIIKCFKEVI